jgi:alpha-amylase
MKKNSLLLLLLLVLNCLNAQPLKNPKTQGEIIYHVCQRSFYDSNGDQHGDLNGLRQKLPYLQDLGVTSILLFPLYEADCYHNYFANNFEQIDSEFGTMQDFLDLVKEVHRRGMKIYLDMETQYVTSEHIWWKDAVGNLNSAYSDFILFEDEAHQTPATMVFDLRILNGYDGKVIAATTVNLKSKKVLEYNIELFSYFMDPNKDGQFDDGVDGFRLDHAMDHLDGKPTLTDLFTTFWNPLIQTLKQINPTIKIAAEQANWSDYGFEYFEKAGVDRMFGFGLQQAILSFDKQQIIENAEIIFNKTPQGKEQIIFVENHDIDRFASIETNFEKQKTAAALMLLMGGVPSIYYGQEIGMKGKVYSFGNTDGNDIGRREAFEWYAKGEESGLAYWYQNSGPWWTSRNSKSNDGISLEEQIKDSLSLYNFYKKIIQIRNGNLALSQGAYQNVSNNNQSVLSFYRISKNQQVLVVVNLSGLSQEVNCPRELKHAKNLINHSEAFEEKLTLKPFEFKVWEVK